MDLFSQFKTKSYIGFDIDQERVKYGTEKYEHAKGIVSSIENIIEHQSLLSSGDLVTCMQTLGINHLFDQSQIVLAVNNLVLLTNKSGTLIFNIRWPKVYSTETKSRVFNILETNFKSVKYKNYGALESLKLSKTNRTSIYLLTIPLTLIMIVFPTLRHTKILSKPSTYFVCSKKN
jgi:hypothetical protein